MTITRRELLRRASLFGAASMIPSFSACAGKGSDDDEVGDTGDIGDATETATEGTETGDDGLPTYTWEGDPGPETLFSHGLASGDPLVDAVILWTRLSPAEDASVEAFFEVALDPAFAQRVAADWIEPTDASRDYTIKIDIIDLDPATTYYYRFYAQGRVSPIGRTRTAPTTASHLRIAVACCASYAHGYFHAYRHLGERADLDLVLHVGDYIYEYASGSYGDTREYDPPTECNSLDDYRRRYKHYRADLDLQEAHRQHPFVTTWDDHEIANDGWVGGAENHMPDTEGEWSDRRAAATQAYFEYLPVREGVPGRLYRHLPYGDLVDVFVLDTRYEGRDLQVSLAEPDGLDQINAPGRQLLGAEQEAWLFDMLSNSTAHWRLIAQQVMVGQLILVPGQNGEFDKPLYTDWWDGYVDARNRLFQHIEDEGMTNVVVVTGDNHSSFANELTYDPYEGYDPATGEGSLAVEFVTPGITSPGLGFDGATAMLFATNNPHTRWSDTVNHGYMILDVTSERIQTDWFHIGGAIGSSNPASPSFAKAWRVDAGAPRLVEASEPVPEDPAAPELAP
ncbi:alkaline phosphatase D family protein [Nannocystaceae bacterium ST9]